VFFIKPLIPCRFFATTYSILSKSGAAVNMLLQGADLDFISKITGISSPELRRLKAKHEITD
jgi:hypothetical protein